MINDHNCSNKIDINNTYLMGENDTCSEVYSLEEIADTIGKIMLMMKLKMILYLRNQLRVRKHLSHLESSQFYGAVQKNNTRALGCNK